MKAAVQFAASLIAAAGLLAGAASHATDVAVLPLKASVLAKPNVIFAMDDSGSMDTEFMLDTNNGYFWWNYSTGVGYSGGKPIYGGGTYDWALLYLFPDGTGTGNRVYGEPDPRYGYGVPPTPELAWLRSSAYNPIYYNPSKTYSPWSPGYVNGALKTYSDAPPGAAPSHPAQGSTTLTLNADINNSSDGWKFTWLTGMTIPTGVTNIGCIFGSAPSAGSLPYKVPSNRGLCKGQMSYYPATYWQKETCTVDGSTCVTAPDGNTLKRYEIKSGVTFPSGRSFADEMKNFANWFTYYRKRRLMLGASMGSVLENLTGLRMGLVPFTPFNKDGTFSAPVTMYDADNTTAATNRFNIIGKFQTAEGSGGTPTRETLKYVGDQFNRTDADTLGNKIVQYACQRNNAFVVTDGFAFANVSAATTPPTYTSATYGAGAPYTTTYANTLADIALSYYTNRLRTDLTAGRVPKDDPAKINSDQNGDLHVNTYGLTLGAKGNIWPALTTPFTTAPTWVNPTTTDRNAIDDLWHATINGRGQMYLATSVEETTTAMQAALNDILSAAGAQSGVAVSTVNLSRGDGYAYLGTYNPAGWTGDLTANAINADTAVISTTPTWSAGTKLLARDWTTRVIASANSSGAGVGFTATDVGSVVNPSSTWGDTTQVMNYLRGDRSLEGTTFRTRTSLIGAVINSEPTIDRDTNMVYVASGEGMLHAIDTTAGSNAGKELWAFVPRENLQDMGQTTARHYVFQTQLDGTPVVGQSGSSSKLLVAGMGAAGRSYYAIDVTSPRSYTQAQLAAAYKWEFPTAGDSSTRAKVGQTMGKPSIVRTADNGYVVLVTSGYNSTADGKGRLWMLSAADGTVIKEFTVSAGTLGAESGLTQVSGFLEDDGTVRYAYGGDLLGNLWRFDLKTQDTPKLLAVLKNAAGTAQPVTAQPELALVQGQRVVLVGTGRILDITDFGNLSVQTFYAISDGDTLNPARDNLVEQAYTRSGDKLTSNPVDWSSQRGWFMDLPSGEQANTHPRIAYGAVSFVTNVTGATDCSASSYLYVLDVASGGKVQGASYVSAQISATANSSGATPVASSSGQPYDLIQTNDGQALTQPLPSQSKVKPSKNSWREVLTQ